MLNCCETETLIFICVCISMDRPVTHSLCPSVCHTFGLSAYLPLYYSATSVCLSATLPLSSSLLLCLATIQSLCYSASLLLCLCLPLSYSASVCSSPTLPLSASMQLCLSTTLPLSAVTVHLPLYY